MMPSGRIAVCLEVTPKQALASYAGRYAPVAAHAGLSVPATAAFEVAEFARNAESGASLTTTGQRRAER